MPYRYALLLTAALLTPAANVGAQTDRVRTPSGIQSGEVTDATPTMVKLQRSGRTVELPAYQVEGVQFGGEPAQLTQARTNALSGSYEKALELLEEIDSGEVDNELVKQEIQYYRAYCAAELAMLGKGSLKAAGTQLNAFASQNRSSFHQLEAQQLLGDLLTAMGNHQAAQAKYAILARTPWPAYQVRSGVLMGKSLQAQDKHAEAIRTFEQAAAIEDDSPETQAQKRAATLGKAVSMAATGDAREAVQMVRDTIAAAAPEEQQLLAQAYNALGASYSKTGDTKAALFAYLHVDLLYPNAGAQHAEALYHLAPLFEQIGKTDDARDARQRLREQYPGTTWARQ